MPASVRLLDWIRENMCPDLGQPWSAPWNGHPRPHLHRVRRHEALPEAAARGGHASTDRAASGSRSTTARRRRRSARRSSGPSTPTPHKHPVRILIATDAAREGLNLQAHCWNLFHFDVPWNPSRMEQRNGRIDRKLQPKPEVFCHYFVYTPAPRGPHPRRCWSARPRRSSGNSAACPR